MSWALVLSGGGTSDLAWETGLLKGLLDHGADLTAPDLFVGTSAGAILAAQLATGQSVADLYADQCEPGAGAPHNVPPTLGNGTLDAEGWPATPLLITAIDATGGSLVVWKKAAGMPLHQAIASSTAPDMDTGAFSGTSAQLAFGHRLVIVVAAARADGPGRLDGELVDEMTQLRAGGSRVELLVPDAASAGVLAPNRLDPARRAASAAAGYAQGAAQAATVLSWLESSPHRIPVVDAGDLAARFTALTLRKAEWTHLAHLAVGMWHVDRYGADEALRRLRDGIRRLNESHGGQNTATAGYHETITAAYVRLLSAFLETCPPGLPWHERVARLFASPLVDRNVLFQAYSREKLLSTESRASWVEPDRAPLTLEAVAQSLFAR